MKSYLNNRISKAMLQAHTFLVDSYEESKDSRDNPISGYPETKGKKRITEWGGTSTAINALRTIGDESSKTQKIIMHSQEWILSRQSPTGAWEASGIYSAEATAGVLLDLGLPPSDSHVAAAIDFLQTCYKDHCFYSVPSVAETPHIYTTYLVTRCLSKYGSLADKDQIINWVKSARSDEGYWGRTPHTNTPTVIHTIFALHILNSCGISWDKIAADYKDQINWITRSYNESQFIYEEMEIPQLQADEYGGQYKRLRLRHFMLGHVGQFFLAIRRHYEAIRVMQLILKLQFAGGWGPSHDELTIWATQQSVEFLDRVRMDAIPNMPNIQLLLALIPYKVTRVPLRILLTILIVVTSVYMFQTTGYRENLTVSIFMLIVVWLFKTRP